MSSLLAHELRTPAWRVSQVPRSFFLRALSAITPTSQSDASAVCFSDRAGFTISGGLATRIFVFRGRIRFNLSAYGSRFRRPARTLAFACLLQTGFAPHASLPPHDKPQLHV